MTSQQRLKWQKPSLFQVQQQQEAVERTIRNGSIKPFFELTVTPKSLPRVRLTCGLLLLKFCVSNWSICAHWCVRNATCAHVSNLSVFPRRPAPPEAGTWARRGSWRTAARPWWPWRAFYLSWKLKGLQRTRRSRGSRYVFVQTFNPCLALR